MMDVLFSKWRILEIVIDPNIKFTESVMGILDIKRCEFGYDATTRRCPK